MIGPIVSVSGTTYSCTGTVGAEAKWKVKTINPGALNSIFGSTWNDVIVASFGPGSNVTGAIMKTEVTYVNSSYVYNPGIGNI